MRKRVIKIFRDICIEQPDFPKIPEMCVKMIRRVNDEEGIRVSYVDYAVVQLYCNNNNDNPTSILPVCAKRLQWRWCTGLVTGPKCLTENIVSLIYCYASGRIILYLFKHS